MPKYYGLGHKEKFNKCLKILNETISQNNEETLVNKYMELIKGILFLLIFSKIISDGLHELKYNFYNVKAPLYFNKLKNKTTIKISSRALYEISNFNDTIKRKK